MPELISFSQFYAGIRAHFAQNPWEYDKYKNNKTNRAKVEYLLGHAIVQNSLATLSAANTSSPLCSIFGNAGKNKDMDKCKGKFSPPRIVGSGKYPQMSKKIEVKATKKKGRIMVAKEKIDPGEVLIHEKPYCTMLYPEFRSTHCNSCFARLQKSSHDQECQHCREAKYCSQDCRSGDFDWFHWAECGLADRLQTDEIGLLALLVYRLMVKSGLQTCIDTHEADLALTDKNSIYDSDDYKSAFLQVTHEEDRDPGDAFKRSAIGLYLTHHLKLAGFFDIHDEDPAEVDFFSPKNKNVVIVVTLILRHLQSCSCNAYEIGELIRGTGLQDEHVQLGGAVYPTVSLSNHSCVPNTVRHNEGPTCVVRSVGTIRKGEEITDNYGFFYQIRPLNERQEALQIQYHFSCDCVACKYHWPMFEEFRDRPAIFVCDGCRAPVLQPLKLKKCPKCKKELKLSRTVRALANFGNEVKEALQTMDLSTMDKTLSHFLALLQLMESSVQHPCADYNTCQQVISQCFARMANMSFVS